MKKRIFWIVLVLVLGAVASRLLTSDKPVVRHESRDTFDQVLSVVRSSIIPESEPASFSMPEELVITNVESENEAVDNGGVYTFQVDGHGHLVLNEGTYLDIERLFTLNTPDELKIKLQKFSGALPLPAYREMVNLLDSFEKYTMTMKQLYPGGNALGKAPETIEDAFNQLQDLHDLRVMNFGADAARAFFEKEETMNRQMLEAIYMEKNSKM